MKFRDLKLLVDLYLGGNITIYLILAICAAFLLITSLPAVNNPILLEYEVTDSISSYSATIYFRGDVSFQADGAELIRFDLNQSKLAEIQAQMGRIALEDYPVIEVDPSQKVYRIRYRFWPRSLELNAAQVPIELLVVTDDLDNLIADVIE